MMSENIGWHVHVSNIKAELYRQACHDTALYIIGRDDAYKAEQIKGRKETLEWALVEASSTLGLAMEFGVAEGDSLRTIAECRPVYGFDSFEGLPEDWRSGFPKGHFAMSACAERIDTVAGIPGSHLVIGRFEETLSPLLIKQWDAFDGEPFIAFVHIDCDLYSSARYVLDHIKPHLCEGAIIVLDEYWNYPGWCNGEFAALEDSEIPYSIIGYNYIGESVVVRTTRQK